MSSFDECLWIEEVFGPPETREPGPADENLRGVSLPARQPVTPTRSLTVWRELKIAAGSCPMPGCGGSLDEDYFCSMCGNVSLPKATEAA